ncbi:MAG TPA: DUF2017 domain-containing protein [Actinomycetales bacterium]|nr:DUF2017 domain-containing protein [Actinomycetales bacterium]
MARGFRRTRHGLRAKLDGQERAVLAHLFVEVYELLDDGTPAETDPLAALVGIGTSVDLPDDPALARLLPDAHALDAEASSEFRRYTEQGLRDRKRACLETARLSLGRDGALTLDDDEGQAWLVALTDVRLVLAERMGLRTEEDHERLMRQVGMLLEGDLDELEADVEPEHGAAPEHDDGPDGGRSGVPGAGELLGQGVDESFGVDAEGEQGPEVDDVRSGAAAGSGATSDVGDEADDDHLDEARRLQLATMLSLYDFLTWLQETLVQAVCED